METLTFKTNIRCSGCVAKVTPNLNQTAGEDNWEVDLQAPGRLLTVTTETATEAEIIAAVSKVGYQAERID